MRNREGEKAERKRDWGGGRQESKEDREEKENETGRQTERDKAETITRLID